ncbi:MAG: hypothetical protein ACFFCQ_12285 [Promethearchaeota archaeon]
MYFISTGGKDVGQVQLTTLLLGNLGISEAGLPVMLATDVSAAKLCESMQMMMILAVLGMKMTTAEA